MALSRFDQALVNGTAQNIPLHANCVVDSTHGLCSLGLGGLNGSTVIVVLTPEVAFVDYPLTPIDAPLTSAEPVKPGMRDLREYFRANLSKFPANRVQGIIFHAHDPDFPDRSSFYAEQKAEVRRWLPAICGASIKEHQYVMTRDPPTGAKGQIFIEYVPGQQNPWKVYYEDNLIWPMV